MLAAALVAASGSAALGAAPAVAARWSPPARIVGPVDLDLQPAVLAAGGGGRVAVGTGVENLDDPAGAQALLSWSAAGRFSTARAVPGAQQALAVGYSDGRLLALAGASGSGEECCSSVEAVGPATPAGTGVRRAVLTGLAGPTSAQLLTQPSGLLALIATERGVWEARAPRRTLRFGRARHLSANGQLPQEMDGLALPGGSALVAWTARHGEVTAAGPRTIFLAHVSAAGAGRAGTLLTVPSGHAVDELALAGGGQPAVAWIESWFDRGGHFHSELRLADVQSRLRPMGIPGAGALASGIAFAGGSGTQLLAWKACTQSGSCTVRVILRRPGHRPGRARDLGPIDPAQTPAVTVTARGQGVVAWIRDGQVKAAGTTGSRWGRTALVSAGPAAADVELGGNGRSGALAVWMQGTVAETMMGSQLPAR